MTLLFGVHYFAKKRHPRICRNGLNCKFLKDQKCFYKHKKVEFEAYQKDINVLQQDIKDLKEDIKRKESQLKEAIVLQEEKDNLNKRIEEENVALRNQNKDLLRKFSEIQTMELNINTCNICKCKRNTEQTVRSHISKQHSQKDVTEYKMNEVGNILIKEKYSCRKCSLQFSDKSTLDNHEHTMHVAKLSF